MYPKSTFNEEIFSNVLTYAKKHAGADYSEGLEVVITTTFKDVKNLPKLRYPKKIDGIEQPIPLEEHVGKWVIKIF